MEDEIGFIMLFVERISDVATGEFTENEVSIEGTSPDHPYESYPLIPTEAGYVFEATASLDLSRYPGPVTYSVRYVDEDPKTNLGFLEIKHVAGPSDLKMLRAREVSKCGVKRDKSFWIKLGDLIDAIF